MSIQKPSGWRNLLCDICRHVCGYYNPRRRLNIVSVTCEWCAASTEE
jgi:hypothetical protein